MSEIPDSSTTVPKKTEPAVTKVTLPVLYNKVVAMEAILHQLVPFLQQINARVELLAAIQMTSADVVFNITGRPPDKDKEALTQKVAELTAELKKYQPTTDPQPPTEAKPVE